MVLRMNDFAAWRISWGDKAASIAALVGEINLGLQSVVFIDDNPAERGRVGETLPEVLVPDWPRNPLLYVEALAAGFRRFDQPSITDEDLVRVGVLNRAEAAARRKSRASTCAASGNGLASSRAHGVSCTARRRQYHARRSASQ